MVLNTISKQIFDSISKKYTKEEFKNADIKTLITEHIVENYEKDIKEKIIRFYDIEKYHNSRLFKIIEFCKEFNLDDIDILDQMWNGVDKAIDELDYEDKNLKPRDKNGHCLYGKDLRKDSSIKSLIKIVDEYNLDIDTVTDGINLYEQVEDYIDSINHARMYYDNQLYYDEKIEAIQEAYNDL